MAKRYHITPEGPKPCSVDASNPRSRGCEYGAGGHFDELQSAEQSYEAQMGGAIPVPRERAERIGPPVPPTLFHIARKSDLQSIMATGLNPAIGDRSEALGEDTPRIYLFDSRVSAEEGLGSWLGDEFDEDEELVLLSVNGDAVEEPTPTYVYEDQESEGGYGPSTEWTSEKIIAGTTLRIEGDI